MSVKTKYWTKIAWFLLVLVALFNLTQVVSVQAQSANNHVVIYFFWGDGCPHCARAKPFLQELSQKYPGVEIRAYEVWNSEANQALFTKMSAAYGFEPQGVPTFFIGERYWIGFSDVVAQEIEANVKTCQQLGCKDGGVGVIPGLQAPASAPASVSGASAQNVPPGENNTIINVPLIGAVNLQSQSLTISTLLISFVDGFNPCSLWVLSMLLALTLHTGSRRKVLIIGLIFITVTAAVYALFIAGLFTMFAIVNFVGWIQVVVSLVALFFGLVNMKDYFWYKEGLSFTIADDQKPGIFQRIRKIMDASQSFWGLAGATVIMAAGVSLVEFSCTAGFPVLWTNLLASQKVGTMTFALLLLLYMIIYQLDELAIFFTTVFTLKASRIEEKQGRILKLIGGTLMITLSVVMLLNPALMNDLTASLLIFGIAFGVAIIILLVHRKILPAFGIWIGSEDQKTR